MAKIEQSFVKYVFIWFKSLVWLAGLRPDDVICVDNDGVSVRTDAQTETKMLDTLQSITVNEKRTANGIRA